MSADSREEFDDAVNPEVLETAGLHFNKQLTMARKCGCHDMPHLGVYGNHICVYVNTLTGSTNLNTSLLTEIHHSNS